MDMLVDIGMASVEKVKVWSYLQTKEIATIIKRRIPTENQERLIISIKGESIKLRDYKTDNII